jgi:quercetin dioxygenase-like cupin family protein
VFLGLIVLIFPIYSINHTCHPSTETLEMSMIKPAALASFALLSLPFGAAHAQSAADVAAVAKVVRKPILTVELPEVKTVDHVRGVSVAFGPGQKTGRHQHPIPVVGYIVSGVISFQIDGQARRILRPGDAFFEPANTTIAVFDNASNAEPASFIGFYLMGRGENEVIRAAP